MAAKQQARDVPAIRVAQAPLHIAVFGKEEGGIGAIDRVFVKQLVGRMQEALRLIRRHDALAAQIRLQVGHQERGGDTFSCYVPNHQPQPVAAEIEEIVVIASYRASLKADPRIFEAS